MRPSAKWESEPAQAGDYVAVRNDGSDTWFYFRCERDGLHLYLQEIKPGQVKALAGHPGVVIPYRYPGGVLRVMTNDEVAAILNEEAVA